MTVETNAFMAMKAGNGIGSKMLSSYERGVLNGAKPSKGDAIEKDYMLRSSMKRMLGLEFELKTPSGSDVTISAMDLMVMNAVVDAIEKPSMDKVAKASSILGEMKDANVEVRISSVDKGLEAIQMPIADSEGK